MPETKLPKLADGSQWEGDHCEVVDEWGGHVRAFVCDNGKNIVEIESDEHGCCAALAEDTIAVIRRANLDPLAIAAKEYATLMREYRSPAECLVALQKLEALL